MAKALNFKTLKKTYMTVTLENGTTIMVGMPTKKILDEFLSIKDYLESDDVTGDAIGEVYQIVAKVMSNNKGGVEIPVSDVEGMDFEDVILFIRAYTEFINEVINSKN